MLHGRRRRLLMVNVHGTSQFEDLELLWKAMDGFSPAGEAALAVGNHMPGKDRQWSSVRSSAMYGLHTIVRIVGLRHIRDTQCGFKLLARRAAQQIFSYWHLTTWIFDVELLLLAKAQGTPAVEVPIEWHEVSGSKPHVFSDSLQMLRDLFVPRAKLGAVFERIGGCKVEWHLKEGGTFEPVNHVANVRGPVRQLLDERRVTPGVLSARCSRIATNLLAQRDEAPMPTHTGRSKRIKNLARANGYTGIVTGTRTTGSQLMRSHDSGTTGNGPASEPEKA
ncbi:uncharacterized protein BXZ73DRAFT_76264 [Epithele typhae]|uniref:uncharacterized protein n=1 Tax=Epithele typhae TaxID=378194 RepID=UPI002008135E|nr:uncharacterized protein BXZ73DRAFT_76264 [Epithele typhae]KAH9938745.1 hypothetical protein BXZ73DRAFT_76264 [Epithele typhae]